MFQYHKILVPLDGSDLAERAIAPAVRIAGAMGARLVLLRAVPVSAVVSADPQLYEELRRLGEEDAMAYLRTVQQDLQQQVSVDVATDHGPAADCIIDYAFDHDVDLIVMSSHGRSGLQRFVYGSVAEKVLRQAPCATAVIRAGADMPLRDSHNVLVPLDGSELAEKAIEPAMALAGALESDVHLLRVTQSGHARLETASMQPVFDQIEAKEIAEAETYLQHKYNELDNAHLFIDVVMTDGSVAEAIMQYAKEHHINLIVMSSHGRSGLSRWMYGSVTEQVLRGACCATLVIRAQTTTAASR